MKAIGIVPARMAATRFPGKPLVSMLGMPMIGHCYHRTRLAPGLAAAYVATCDQLIVDYVESIGGRAVMTSAAHNRASTRTAEALEIIERETGEHVDVVVMVQGDEPLIAPETIGETHRVAGSKGAIYAVTNDRGSWTCTCPASKWQRGDCKHIVQLKG